MAVDNSGASGGLSFSSKATEPEVEVSAKAADQPPKTMENATQDLWNRLGTAQKGAQLTISGRPDEAVRQMTYANAGNGKLVEGGGLNEADANEWIANLEKTVGSDDFSEKFSTETIDKLKQSGIFGAIADSAHVAREWYEHGQNQNGAPTDNAEAYVEDLSMYKAHRDSYDAQLKDILSQAKDVLAERQEVLSGDLENVSQSRQALKDKGAFEATDWGIQIASGAVDNTGKDSLEGGLESTTASGAEADGLNESKADRRSARASQRSQLQVSQSGSDLAYQRESGRSRSLSQ